MELKTFIENFASQFEDTPVEEFKANTDYKNLKEWDSLMLLTIIAMIDDEYNVVVKGEDFKNIDTIEDLFNLVKSRK